MYEFRLPDIGEGLNEAELLQWLVKVGDHIAEGDDVASISTEKVNVDLPSPRSGVVAELPWEVGDVIPVGDVFMRISDTNEDSTESQSAPAKTTAVSNPADVPVRENTPRMIAAPALRRYAKEKDVDLALVTPSAPDGRLLRADIDAYLQQQAGEAESGEAVTETFKLSGARLTAARRLSESSRTLATTTQTFEVYADAIIAETQRLSEKRSKDSARISPLPVIAKCIAKTLSRHNKFNASIDESDAALRLHGQINLGFAVDTEAGLVVAVVKDVNDKDTLSLAAEISDIAQRARENSLKLEDIRGATFTLSSTGGLERATMVATTPVINLPNVAMLWVSRITDRPRVVAGKLEAGPVMACTLSFDHRFIDGAEGTAFINDLNDDFRQL
jgi:pyruvate/2-oxoglutarate dehydrogenase complex dihydrolipoamide acyltransferase (E2) component